MTGREESRIQTAEMNVLRTVIGKTMIDRVRNETVRESVGVKPMMNKVDAARLRCWGHLEIMQEERESCKQEVEVEVEMEVEVEVETGESETEGKTAEEVESYSRRFIEETPDACNG